MDISNELFTLNTYDIHRIQKAAALRHEILNLENETEQLKTANELYYNSLLQDCFINLFQINPGFQQVVLTEIAKDSTILEKTQRYINKLYSDHNGDISSYYLSEGVVEKNPDEPVDIIISNLIKDYAKASQNILYPAHSKINPEFAAFALEDASRNFETEITFLIPYLVQYPEIYHNSHLLLQIDPSDSSSVTDKQFKQSKFREKNGRLKVLEKINFSHEFKVFNSTGNSFFGDIRTALNNSNKPDIPEICVGATEWTKEDELLFGLTPILKDIRKKLAAEFKMNYCPENFRMTQEEFAELTDKEKQDYVKFQKFTTDVLTIAAEFWFDKKDQDEKIDALNADYSFFPTEDTLEEFSTCELDNYANRLINSGYYIIAECIYSYILNSAKTDIDKFWCHIALGHCARNCFAFPTAHDHYKSAQGIIEQYQSDSNWMNYITLPFNHVVRSALYWKILTNLIAGEMSWHLDCYSEVEESIDQAIKYKDNIPDGEEKAIIFREILDVCKNTNHHEREPAVLEILLKQSSFIKSDKDKEYYKKRYDLLRSLSKEEIKALQHDQDKLDLDHYIEEFLPIIEQAMLSNQHHLASIYAMFLDKAQKKTGVEEEFIAAIVAITGYRLQEFEYAFLLFHNFFGNCKDRNFLLYYPYLGISQVLYGKEKKNDKLVDTGIKNLQSSVQQMFTPKPTDKSEEDLQFLLSLIASELIHHGKDVTEQVLDSLYDVILMNFGSSNKTCNYLAATYSDIAWNAKAYGWLNKMPAKKERYGCTYRLPYIVICIKDGNLKDAIKMCNKVLSNPGRHPKEEQKAILPLLASAYYKELKFAEARDCYQKAEKCGWSDENSIIDGLNELLDNRISLKSIDNSEAKKSFISAERLFSEFYLKQGKNESLDFSGYHYHLFKGVEIITHQKVGLPLRKAVLDKFGAKNGSGIPGKDYKNLSVWKGLLTIYPDKIQTASLGTLGRIIEKEQCSENKIMKFIYTSLREKFNEDLDLLVDAWKMMAPERNKIDHISVQDKVDMLKMRKEFVDYANEVIRILYRSSNVAHDPPATITVCDSSLIFEGWEAVENKEYQRVIEIADTILKTEEISAEAYSMKACAYMNLNQLDQAMTFIDKALEEDPDDSDNLVLKGNIYGMKEDYIQALAWYSKAVTAYLWNDDAIYDIGLTYHKMGDYGMALETFARLKEMNPDHPQLTQGVEDTEYNLQLYQSKIERYDNILQTKELTPEKKEFIGVTRAIELFHVGRYEDAIKEAEKWKNSAKKYLENPQVFDLSIELSLSALSNLNKVQKIYAHPYYTKDNLPKLT